MHTVAQQYTSRTAPFSSWTFQGNIKLKACLKVSLFIYIIFFLTKMSLFYERKYKLILTVLLVHTPICGGGGGREVGV